MSRKEIKHTRARRLTLATVPDPIPASMSAAPSTMPVDALLTLGEVAKLLKVHPATVYALIARGRFPRSIDIGGGRIEQRTADSTRRPTSRWSSNEVQAWIAGQLAKRAG